MIIVFSSSSSSSYCFCFWKFESDHLCPNISNMADWNELKWANLANQLPLESLELTWNSLTSYNSKAARIQLILIWRFCCANIGQFIGITYFNALSAGISSPFPWIFGWFLLVLGLPSWSWGVEPITFCIIHCVSALAYVYIYIIIYTHMYAMHIHIIYIFAICDIISY